MVINKEDPLKKVLELGRCELGKDCDKCNQACQQGSGCFVDEQLSEVAEFLGVSEKELKEKYLEEVTKFNTTLWRPKIKKKGKPYGECIFWGGGCKIHEVKPLECQLATHKKVGEETSVWFMLNYFVNEHDAESVREWAQYIKSGGRVIPGGSLRDLVPDKKRLKKILNYKELGGLENGKEKR